MARTIQHKRGLEKDLPTLKPGELAITTDTKKTFIGTDSGNVEIPNKSITDALTITLREKATKGEVTTLSQRQDQLVTNLSVKPNISDVILKSEGVGLNNANPDLLEAIQGGIGTPLEVLSIPRGNSVQVGQLGGRIESNLFNKKTITRNKYLNNTGAVLDHATLVLSDYVPVVPGRQYIVSYGSTSPGGYFDKNFNWISKIQGPSSGVTQNQVLEAPNNAHWVRLNMQLTQAESWMMVEGNVYPSKYIEYGTKLEWLKIGKENLDSHLISSQVKWEGKKIVTFGDSITWYDQQQYNNNTNEPGVTVKGYQSYMRESLGATVLNEGASGNTMQQICSRIKTYDFSDIHLCTIMGGTNNYRDKEEDSLGAMLPIGSIFDETKFTGALQSSIEYILTNNPECKVMLFTPIKGWYASSANRTPMTTKIPDRILEVAELYGLSTCDLYRNSGINELTEQQYVVDKEIVSFRFHPSTKGYKRMADILIPFLYNN